MQGAQAPGTRHHEASSATCSGTEFGSSFQTQFIIYKVLSIVRHTVVVCEPSCGGYTKYINGGYTEGVLQIFNLKYGRIYVDHHRMSTNVMRIVFVGVGTFADVISLMEGGHNAGSGNGKAG